MESPKKRKLAYAHAYRNTVISLNAGSIKCIYSGKKINSPESLDHFLPWSFLPNDKTWNIIPTISLLSDKSIKKTFQNTILNYYNLAEEQGFAATWKYTQAL